MDKAQEFYKKSKPNQVIKKEINPFSLWSFILAVIPFFLFPFTMFILMIPFMIIFYILGLITSIVLAIISFSDIKKNYRKYFGIGFSVAAIIISGIQILIMLILILFFFGIDSINMFNF